MLSKVSVAIVNFLRWWGSELKGIFSTPDRVGSARHPLAFILSIENERVRIIDKRNQQVAELEDRDNRQILIEDAANSLTKILPSTPRATVGLRFANQDCFRRRIELPVAARKDVEKVLELELERTTPFRRGDVYAAYYIENETTPAMGKLAVHQLIIKRSTVDPAIEALSQVGIAPAFADCWNLEGTAPLPIDFLSRPESEATRHSKGWGLAPVLTALSVAFTIAALTTTVVRHQSALKEITAATATAKSEAHMVRQALQKSQQTSTQIELIKRLRRQRTSAAHILEELTTLIPDSAWLSDLRIEGEMVEFTGYAKSAASLIPRFEKSKLFTAATLTAPVMLDARQDKERFSIRVRVRDGAAPQDTTQKVRAK